MNTIQKIVGVNLLIMSVYIIVVGLISNELLFGTMLLLPLHVLLLFVISVGYYISYINDKENKGEELKIAKAYFLTSFVVAVVGFSSCSSLLELHIQ